MINSVTWSVVSLQELAKQINYGFTASAKESGNAKFLRITDIQGDGVNWETVPLCSCTEEELKK